MTKRQLDPPEAHLPVGSLENITAREVKKLRTAGILVLNDLWTSIGGPELELTALDKVADKTKIPSYRLLELLPASLTEVLQDELLRRARDLDLPLPDGVKPSTTESVSIGRRASLVVRKAGPWFRRHLLDIILFLGVLTLAGLALRATGFFDTYQPPIGLNPNVVITKRDLKAGDVLQAERDLTNARLPLKQNYFTSTSDLERLIVKRDVSSYKPLRTDDLLRLQVVATRDIAAGETIVKDAVKLDWLTYDPKALLQISDTTDQTTRHAIRKDNVILVEMLMKRVDEPK